MAKIPDQGEQGICFISEYREILSDEARKSIIHAFKIVSDICINNDIKLSVALSSSRSDKNHFAKDEIEFFGKIHRDFDYSDETSYLFAIKSRTVVCMLSNLGLELVSLGYKVFFLDTHQLYDSKIWKNYFSYNFGKKGIFWDKGYEYKSVEEKIIKLYKMEKVRWKNIYKKYPLPVQYFDPNNTILKKIIESELGEY